MAYPYKRSFQQGHQSELLYNEDLHKIYESVRHLTEIPEDGSLQPEGKMPGALWLDQAKNILNAYHTGDRKYHPIFKEKFQLIDQMLNDIPPADPVIGQLWLNNECLCYWNGMEWRPVKAVEMDASQFNLAIFENYILISPMWTQGNTCFKDPDLEKYLEIRRMYLQAKIDYMHDAEGFGDGKKWTVDDISLKDLEIPSLKEVVPVGYHQFLVPNIKYARIFKDDRLDFGYDTVNSVTVQYPKMDIVDHVPSMIHCNPAQLTSIKKRFFKINRKNPKIYVPPKQTEYYGYRKNEICGHFLWPEKEADDGGYIIDNDCIILSYNQCQDYDYVLAVTWEFRWVRKTGFMTHIKGQNEADTYSVQGFLGENSIFIGGLNLEKQIYKEYSKDEIVKIFEPTDGLDIQMLHTDRTEAGYIREVDLQGKAVINTLRDYAHPLVFVNGEAMNYSTGDYVKHGGNMFLVKDGRLNMSWRVVDLLDRAHPLLDSNNDCLADDYVLQPDGTIAVVEVAVDEDGYRITYDAGGNRVVHKELPALPVKYYDMLDCQGIVSDTDSYGNGYIYYNSDDICWEKAYQTVPGSSIPTAYRYVGHAVLFIDGLMVTRDDIVIDETSKTMTVPGLKAGQNYILLHDKYNYFRGNNDLLPALSTGRLSESMVYLKGYLLCSDSAVLDTSTPNVDTVEKLEGEIKLFVKDREDYETHDKFKTLVGEYRIYDSKKAEWVQLGNDEVLAIDSTCRAYRNTVSGVIFKNEELVSKNKDQIHIYAYVFANNYDHVLTINSFMVQKDRMDPNWVGAYPIEASGKPGDNKLNGITSDGRIFKLPDQYVPNANTLSMWLNGVKIYPDQFKESVDGYTVEFDEPIMGMLTYVIEQPENGNNKAMEYEILDDRNAVKGSINLFRTKNPLFPGRVTLYIDGIRQPNDRFTVVDNYTLMVLGDTPLADDPKIYKDQTFFRYDGETRVLHRDTPTKLLVEVHQDTGWREDDISVSSPEIKLIDYDLPTDILSSADEIMVFVGGLFLGLKCNDGYTCKKGYIKSPDSGKLYISRSDVVDRIATDPMLLYLLNPNPNKEPKHVPMRDMKWYESKYGKEYVPAKKDIILEWR